MSVFVETVIVGTGVGISKAADSIPVKPADEKAIVASVTPAALVAVNPLNVDVPLLPATVVVPPNVHVPEPVAATTFAVLAVVFPY